MIDWYGLLANSLWILGLAILLARLSFAWFYRAQPAGRRAPGDRIDLAQIAGFFLFCLGLCLSADSLIERIAWAFFAVMSVAWPVWEAHRRSTGKI